MAAVEGHERGLDAESNPLTVQERLTQRNQTRLEEADKHKEAQHSLKLSEEKSDYFNSEFKKERAAIEELLCAGANRTADKVERAAARTALLQKFLNDSMPFLTQYDLRRAQTALQNLQTALGDAREAALPKKKFAFQARTKATEKTPAPSANPGATTTDGKNESASTEAEQCEFSHLNDANITKSAEEIEQRDVLLTHLRNCTVKLLGAPSTLHLKHIDHCVILCGPVSSSVFVDQCRDSTLAVPCQQLRAHNTTDTRVYLHVTSRAIVEDCTGVGFAPFTWSYPGLERDFAMSGLDRSRNHWSDVDDFNWLSAESPSPNWSVIPEDERRTAWDTESTSDVD